MLALPRLLARFTGTVLLLSCTHLAAQTCFDYVDSCSRPGWTLPMPLPNCVNANVPIRCVQQGPLGTGSLVNCFWNPSGRDCHEDGNPADCCTTVVSGVQSILEMHTAWHDCFGQVGDNDNNNPPGRGARWYAFHRQFEFDFARWREAAGFGAIQHLDWCPGMLMPIGHFSGGWAPGSHPAGCGTGPSRPSNVACPECVAFPQCLFQTGGGPIACPNAPSATCGGSGFAFPYTSLNQFANIEEVTTILDRFFHGTMHGAVGVANRHGPTCDPFDVFNTCDASGNNCNLTNCYVLDVIASNCSPRDPMFWRLHKALDDVVRAWQNLKSVDVMLVIDTSGSMSEPDSGGDTKFEAALDALDSFADLLDVNRADGQQNRIGIVTFSSSASLRMPLTFATATLRAPGGTLDTTINAIRSTGPGGCTGIGAGVQRALQELCPPSGDCRGFTASGDNDRKAILVLTDGMENRPPCLQSAGPTPAAGCGNQCFGPSLDVALMEFTQMVGVGFGNAGSLNGDLLTLIAERQGGIYMQNPNGPADDLKDFFAKGFGRLTADFLAVDPKGTLRPNDAASDPVRYNSCGDAMITFASGWKKDVKPGELRLLVNTPSGELVRGTAPDVQLSTERQWAHSRVRLPYRAESKGTWRAQLVRPHEAYVNGFAPDAFAQIKEGIAVIRREIQRLCPDGCRRVLIFEQGLRGRSAYADALLAERRSGSIGTPVVVTTPEAFASRLDQWWDLIAYAQVGSDQQHPYDERFGQLLCRGQRAIITDTRPRAGAAILRCAGAEIDGSTNWRELTGDERLLDGTIKMFNPGHPIATYGMRLDPRMQATANSRESAGIIARVVEGQEQNWFVDVLADGLSRLSPVREKLSWRTGEDLVAVVRILPSDIQAGGYDKVDARVEIQYPTVGLGTVLARNKIGDARQVRGESLDGRASALGEIVIPMATATFPLYDDGTHGDMHPGNAYWTATLPGLARVDGMYKFRYILDLTTGDCTTRRELTQSIFVDVGVKKESSDVNVLATTALPDRRVRADVRIRPSDTFGNLLGPGRADAAPACRPMDRCSVDRITDHGDGAYTVSVTSVAGRSNMRLEALGATFDIPLPCDTCPRLVRLMMQQSQFAEHSATEATVVLSAPSSKSGLGTVVYLESSHPTVASVPDMAIVPPGEHRSSVPVQILHAHEGAVHITLTATAGKEERSRSFTVMPLPPQEGGSPVAPPKEYIHGPMDHKASDPTPHSDAHGTTPPR